MSVLSTATSSARVLYGGNLTATANTVVYTSPGFSSNVTTTTAGTSTSSTGSATAIIKEISLCNITSSPVTATVLVEGVAIVYGLTINGNDTKILSGLNTMVNSSSTIQAWAGTANAIGCLISGVEVQ